MKTSLQSSFVYSSMNSDFQIFHLIESKEFAYFSQWSLVENAFPVESAFIKMFTKEFTYMTVATFIVIQVLVCFCAHREINVQALKHFRVNFQLLNTFSNKFLRLLHLRAVCHLPFRSRIDDSSRFKWYAAMSFADKRCFVRNFADNFLQNCAGSPVICAFNARSTLSLSYTSIFQPKFSNFGQYSANIPKLTTFVPFDSKLKSVDTISVFKFGVNFMMLSLISSVCSTSRKIRKISTFCSC